jgi:ELWxxDGT repeat protein
VRPRLHVESLEPRLALAGLPKLLGDLQSAAGNSYPQEFVEFAGVAYFAANGAELWKSDGTTTGTSLVYSVGFDTDDYLSRLRVHRGLLVFARVNRGDTPWALDDDRVEIWKSDGTATGTALAYTFGPGSTVGGMSEGAFFATTNGKLIASVSTPTVGTELWEIDLDSSNASLVKDINPGQEGSNPGLLFEHRGVVYFSATDGSTGYELWRTDGTPAGTRQVKDINPNSAVGASSAYMSSYPSSFVEKDGRFYFATQIDGGDGLPFNEDDHAQLWSSDGSTAGTVLVKDFGPWSEKDTWRNVGGTLFGNVLTAELGWELWKSDGTEAGTTLVKDIHPNGNIDPFENSSNPRYLTEVNGLLYFVADDGVHGVELWKSDGTHSGTMMVKDIYPVNEGLFNSSYPDDLTNANGTLYFTADDGSIGFELWKTDGTVAGTELVGDLHATESSFPWNLTPIRNHLFFSATDEAFGSEPWAVAIDQELAGVPAVLADLSMGAGGSYPDEFIEYDGLTYFFANRTQLWSTDGTTSGTQLVFDGATIGEAYLANLHLHDGLLVFARINRGGNPLDPDEYDRVDVWKSNGTYSGTTLVYDFGSYSAVDVSIGAYFVSAAGKLFTQVFTPTIGAELWKVDLHLLTAEPVKDIQPGEFGSHPQNYFARADALYFSANDGDTGWELWKTDGTGQGTMLVKNINTNSVASNSGSSFPNNFVTLGDRFYFTVQLDGADGSAYTADDVGQLWSSNGTIPGTVLVKDFGAGSRAGTWKNFNGMLVGNVSTPDRGAELWKSNGTLAGTVLLKDIRANSSPDVYNRGSNPYDLTEVNGTLFFVANDEPHGAELWKTDGTTAGTMLVKDIRPSNGVENLGSYPHDLTNVQGTLYFTAYDETIGSELWKTDGTAAGTKLVGDLNPIDSSGPFYLTSIQNHLFFMAWDALYGAEPWVIRISRGTDFGDAPQTYRTLAAEDGARHELFGDLALGTVADADLDGQPSVRANGDDLTSTPNDEDGLSVTPRFTVGQTTTLTLRATAAGQIDAWLDWNRNGFFDHPQEHLAGGTSLAVQAGENALSLSVPTSATVGATYLRIRVSSSGSLRPEGLAFDGEVEDYHVAIRAPGSLSDWQNPAFPVDSNGDGIVTAPDALAIINTMNQAGSRLLGASPGVPVNWFDVTGDGYVTPRDVLVVINRLNQGSGEGESAPDGLLTANAPSLAKLAAERLARDWSLAQVFAVEESIQAVRWRLDAPTALRRIRFR